MTKKFNKRELNKYLEHLSKKELEQEVLKLYSKFKEIKAYYQLELGSPEDRAELLANYKEQITLKYFPKRGFGDPSNAEIRKILNQYKKIAIFKHEIAALLLHRIEITIKYSRKYGYCEDSLYNSVFSNFEELVQLMEVHQLTDLYLKDCKQLVSEWAYGEDMQQILNQRFE